MTDTIGAGQPGQDAFPPVEELSYEQARDELIETVKILELGQMGLDESLKYWERGEALAKACEAHLDGASKRVEEALRKNAEGTDSAVHNEEAGED
ncbi:MAG: exodeoxyribonuclease VII small subunit [Corynebacterium aurimucosum]|uniref:exodeoxyribonuclease VII small subunit n=1 Tax=Corynebacterium TaxID=1716 RepID=UPI0008A5764C|nr:MULTISPECIES: exodeoxyribonuclease VII small subunit [Corynebacterium]OFL20834.1 exodeoxyribonuclease VII small subunit [Corynebacterium sp. HMSC062A03]QQU95229.1 exodeoxyribonuclease VII small subunit [Corynebacterium aurimucosum]UTA71864.1 exodeoxyribonuclease VII small subunit [Corynebacterium aurimucosum]WJY70120.1 exodeoxyribonuclease VII small subunit [Corynebacterium aurimucosum]